MDDCIEKLVVSSAVIASLLKQKTYFEVEVELELLRFERFKCEGAPEFNLQVQENVVKNTKSNIPGIVHKLKAEIDVFDDLVRRNNKHLKELSMYDKFYQRSMAIVLEAKDNLKRTT